MPKWNRNFTLLEFLLPALNTNRYKLSPFLKISPVIIKMFDERSPETYYDIQIWKAKKVSPTNWINTVESESNLESHLEYPTSFICL